MSIVQFISAMERYSADVLLLALAVCLLTSVIKKAVPQQGKKYMTVVPFIAGCLVYAAYMFFTAEGYNVLSAQTVSKGIQCGAAATIYYVVYEQFIRGKRSLSAITDIKQLAAAGILKEIVIESQLYNVSAYLTEKLSGNLSDIPYCITLCVSALNGKTRPGVTETEVAICARLLVSSLSALKQ